MERCVIYLCGLWFWVTRRWRVATYSEAAETLELARAYLLRDFFSYASTQDRGALLPFHHEALSLLQNHAADTYLAASQMASVRYCCELVAEELRRLESPHVAPEPSPTPVELGRAPAPVRVRFSPARALRFSLPGSARLPGLARFVGGDTSRFAWHRPSSNVHLRPRADSALTTDSAEEPLKAA